MNKETIGSQIEKNKKEITKEIREKIEKGLREGVIVIDANRISEIAEGLKSGGLGAGDELNEKAMGVYREELITQELSNL